MCATCGTSGNVGSSSCSKLRAMDVETPLNNISNGDENFCFTEITSQICESLKNDEGIHPSVTNQNTDCEDLSSLNDLATGSLHNALMTLNMCDVDAYKCWLDSLLSWQWNVDKGIICAICGLWEKVHCLDEKTQQSVKTVDLWVGEKNIFDLPTVTLTQNVSSFSYLDLHTVFGTEHTVLRFSLEGGTSGFPTATTCDKVARNTAYQIGDGAMAFKELAVQFPSLETVKIHHFIWSLTGCWPSSLNETQAARFITFSDTAATKAYNDTQDSAQDRTHKLLRIEGIISKKTESCFS